MAEEPREPVPGKTVARKTVARKTVALNRRSLVTRLWRAAAVQVQAHEAHLKALPEGAVPEDSDAKALATLARTLRELMLLDATARDAANAGHSGEADGATEALDTLRDELAQRLDGLVAEAGGMAAAAAGDAAGPAAAGRPGAGLADLGPA